MDKTISRMLIAYRQGNIDNSKLMTWLEAEKSQVEKQFPRGPFLKLRHGNDYARMSAIAQMLTSCALCASVGEPRQFTTRHQYSEYSKRRDVSVAGGTLRIIQPPSWTIDGPQTANAVMYYQCSACGAIWAFGEPEREDNGFWTRLA